MPELSPESGFQISLFGSVVPVETTTNKQELAAERIASVEIPPEVKVALSQIAAWYPTQPNTTRTVMEIPANETEETDDDGNVVTVAHTAEENAATFRLQIEAFAAESKIDVVFPVHVPAHWSIATANPKTGIVHGKDGNPVMVDAPAVDADGKPIVKNGEPVMVKVPKKAKWVKDNGVPKRFNRGANVTFRFPSKQEASKNGEVTVTQTEPTPGNVPSRGQQILGATGAPATPATVPSPATVPARQRSQRRA